MRSVLYQDHERLTADGRRAGQTAQPDLPSRLQLAFRPRDLIYRHPLASSSTAMHYVWLDCDPARIWPNVRTWFVLIGSR
jgi:hypothetical protein